VYLKIVSTELLFEDKFFVISFAGIQFRCQNPFSANSEFNRKQEVPRGVMLIVFLKKQNNVNLMHF